MSKINSHRLKVYKLLVALRMQKRRECATIVTKVHHNISVRQQIRSDSSDVAYSEFPQMCMTHTAHSVISQQGTGAVLRLLGYVYVFLSNLWGAKKMENFHLFTEGSNHSLCFPGFFLANSLNFIQRIDLNSLLEWPNSR